MKLGVSRSPLSLTKEWGFRPPGESEVQLSKASIWGAPCLLGVGKRGTPPNAADFFSAGAADHVVRARFPLQKGLRRAHSRECPNLRVNLPTHLPPTFVEALERKSFRVTMRRLATIVLLTAQMKILKPNLPLPYQDFTYQHI
jgi:hypothetical protein